MTIMEKSEFLDYYIIIYVFLDSFHPLEHVLLRQWSFSVRLVVCGYLCRYYSL